MIKMIFVCLLPFIAGLSSSADAALTKSSGLKTLSEFLRENPSLKSKYINKLHVGKRGNDKCVSVCGTPPRADPALQCARWAEELEMRQGCICVKEYKCCPTSCPIPNEYDCWGNHTSAIEHGFVEGPDHFFYKYFSDEKDWIDAKLTCESYGATLVMEKSEETRKHIVNTYSDKSGYGAFWIGIHNFHRDGDFRYLDGSPLGATHWNPGEPNGQGIFEVCVLENLYGPSSWRVMDCRREFPFLCQAFRGGVQYPVKTKDCCGCDTFQCHTCAAVIPQEALCPSTYPLHCYAYNPRGQQHQETRCYESTCIYTPRKAPADEACDQTCMKPKIVQNECGLDHVICVSNRIQPQCPLDSPTESSALLHYPLSCYNAPNEIPHPEGGKWWDDGTCVDCTQWDYPKKSCATEDAAVVALDCHQHKDLDEVCWTKSVTKDQCDCNVAECLLAASRSATHKFPVAETCPVGHVKKTGVSICNQERDVCILCPKVVEPECNLGTIVNDKNANGCDIKACIPPAIPDEECPSNIFKFYPETKKFVCQPQCN